MPELPEVETVRRVLIKNLIDLKIVKIESNYPEMVSEDFEEFKRNLMNKTFKDIKRMGKFLIFELDGIDLVSHLRMEGKFFYSTTDMPLNKHIHMVFTLDNGYELRYQDTRKFGRMVTKKNTDLLTTPPLIGVAKDANDSSFTKGELYNKLKGRKIPIKEALLNQEIIAGLGNIYVDEVLFKSHLSPLKPTNEITIEMCSDILASSKEILDKAIEYKGTTIRSYTSSLGVYGEYQQFLTVHTKEICPTCGKEITKIRVGGRGTYYCVNCQR